LNTTEVRKILTAARRVLVTSHVDPDGDAIGSELAALSLLGELGKDVEVVNQEEVPQPYRFLPGAESILSLGNARGGYDTCVILDCASFERVGKVSRLIDPSSKIVNIDHHPSNAYFGTVNLVVPEASATAAVLVRLIEDLAIPIGPERATCLYAAMVADTGSFRYSNTSAESLKTCARLVDEGADPSMVASQLFGNKGIPGLRLLGEALLSLEVLNGGSVAMISLRRESFEKHGAVFADCDGFVNYAQSIKGVRIGILLREIDRSLTKASFRSDGTVDVDLLAREFGGGGHPTAAGARIQGSLDDVRKRILDGVERFLLSDRDHQGG